METVQNSLRHGTFPAPSARPARRWVGLIASLLILAPLAADPEGGQKLSRRTQSAITHAVLVNTPPRTEAESPAAPASDDVAPVTMEKLVVETAPVATVAQSATQLRLKSINDPKLNLRDGGALYQPAWARGRLVVGAWNYADPWKEDSHFHAQSSPTAKWDLVRLRW